MLEKLGKHVEADILNIFIMSILQLANLSALRFLVKVGMLISKVFYPIHCVFFGLPKQLQGWAKYAHTYLLDPISTRKGYEKKPGRFAY